MVCDRTVSARTVRIEGESEMCMDEKGVDACTIYRENLSRCRCDVRLVIKVCSDVDDYRTSSRLAYHTIGDLFERKSLPIFTSIQQGDDTPTWTINRRGKFTICSGYALVSGKTQMSETEIWGTANEEEREAGDRQRRRERWWMDVKLH